MMRFLHIIAIAALVASAGYAYSIKYDTIYYAEQVAKLKSRIQREKDAIAVLRAEWQHLNRSDRLQVLAERHLDLQPLSINQIVRMSDIPTRQPKIDEIGRKLEALGLGPTPQGDRVGEARTPSSTATP
ncbi:hypothetical protein QNA08_10260 [Chelatococcus sp. SYSU_G07232]|uniref:Cell division protein FtsL n=1 Tax=Chelatococcus albus TaxID=3047466 RepID=A0ABT7AH01_9HYPH|nr:hypothetical protein [Chelatococcus sp. SYSU_G07232]MDJ1158618.1 hypothetical protein [Chelatococcus sp. SYSU_G07232]